MNRIRLISAGFILLMSAPSFAQEWIEYTDREELFQINFPGQPTVRDITYETQSGETIPARVYTAQGGPATYAITVVNYKDAEAVDYRGSTDWAAWNFRKRAREVTFDAHAVTDWIVGHQLQLTNPDGTRSYIGIHPHMRRLYIMEATAPADYPPPSDFPQTLAVLDEQGRAIRYELDDEGNRVRRIFADEQYDEEFKHLEGLNEVLPPC
jgi:YD repeat-containing protein